MPSTAKSLNSTSLIFLLVLSASVHAQTQAPVEDRVQALQQGQYRAGSAHRALEQARHEAKLAEQDVLNLRDANAAAQMEAAFRKGELDKSEKTLAAARARLQAAQRAYDDAVGAVDAVPRAAPVGQTK
jgi:predicted lipid-binding transport protein (Tim44 family)